MGSITSVRAVLSWLRAIPQYSDMTENHPPRMAPQKKAGGC